MATGINKFYLDKFFTEININQDCIPWWCSAIISWLQMVNRLLEASGRQKNYMLQCEEALKKNPSKISNLYQKYSDVMRNEYLRQK